MSRIIIFDFEVFKYDTLLGAIVLEKDKQTVFQSWDLETIKKFYFNNTDSLWIGHNNEFYDNFILEGVVTDKDVKKISDSIINKTFKKKYVNIMLYYYDLMKFHMGSLKTIEAFMGKNISETEVDFDIDRKLTDEEKKLTESYNLDDLNQTLDDFNYLKENEIELRLNLIEEFHLSIDCLAYTEARLAAKVLGAKRIQGIENMPVEPILYDNLKIKNKEAIDFYLGKSWKNGAELKLMFGDTVHFMKSGGMHGALNKIYCEEALYLDVSGYYNLIMINYDLLPRSIPLEGKKLYKELYEEQLRLKKINPRKRQVYKIILLAVFGAQSNEYSDFYDPYQGDLVRMTGQIFLIDLLEKLDPVSIIIQSNTDGIIIKCKDGYTKEDIKKIIDEWQQRTGFVLKFDTIYKIYQRDVNNYLYIDNKGNINVKGEALKPYETMDNPYKGETYKSKEPPIISYCIVNYLANDILPEQTVEQYKDQLRMFQYICKKNSFDWLEYQCENKENNEIAIDKLQNVNRVFAYNSNKLKGMIYKRKYEGKTTKAKYQNLPDNVFVYNDEIMSEKAIKKVRLDLDYDYYITRAYERIGEFIIDE